jgi:hypothetical protein
MIEPSSSVEQISYQLYARFLYDQFLFQQNCLRVLVVIFWAVNVCFGYHIFYVTFHLLRFFFLKDRKSLRKVACCWVKLYHSYHRCKTFFCLQFFSISCFLHFLGESFLDQVYFVYYWYHQCNFFVVKHLSMLQKSQSTVIFGSSIIFLTKLEPSLIRLQFELCCLLHLWFLSQRPGFVSLHAAVSSITYQKFLRVLPHVSSTSWCNRFSEDFICLSLSKIRWTSDIFVAYAKDLDHFFVSYKEA